MNLKKSKDSLSRLATFDRLSFDWREQVVYYLTVLKNRHLFYSDAPTRFMVTYPPKRKILSVGIGAHGIVAVGVTAHGIVSIGIISHGIISIGVISMGVFSTGLISMGVLAGGLVSMGILTAGPSSMSLMNHSAEPTSEQMMEMPAENSLETPPKHDHSKH